MEEPKEEKSVIEDAALIGLSQRSRLFASLLSKGLIPEEGLPVFSIREMLVALASLDMNNELAVSFNDTANELHVKRTVGAGEREGRIASSLVGELHFGFSHGVGRSGSLTEKQPKALGSSILARFANSLALHAVTLVGLETVSNALVVPMATGMSLALCLGAWRRLKPAASKVVYLRVDQRSGFKAIFFPGLEPIVLDCIPEEDSDGLTTDIANLRALLERKSSEILAVLSTTSCFAPRCPDNLTEIGRLCAEFKVFHLVNNAYGLQSRECRKRITQAGSIGHIDAFVQSLDKNFLVPVGGSIICTFRSDQLDRISSFYPGRASVVPCRDFAITMLELGTRGLLKLYRSQEVAFDCLREKLTEFAESVGQRVLSVPSNVISLAMSLRGFRPEEQTLFGSMLFARGVSGARVVSRGEAKSVEGTLFRNYGSHSSRDLDGYLNVASAIGMSTEEVIELIDRLRSTYSVFLKDLERNASRAKVKQSDVSEENGDA